MAFLDEVFKANSAILNALLTLLNERAFDQGADRIDVPLATLVPMFRGQTLSGPKLDRSRIEEVGVSLADGNPGAFALEIDWIKAE